MAKERATLLRYSTVKNFKLNQRLVLVYKVCNCVAALVSDVAVPKVKIFQVLVAFQHIAKFYCLLAVDLSVCNVQQIYFVILFKDFLQK